MGGVFLLWQFRASSDWSWLVLFIHFIGVGWFYLFTSLTKVNEWLRFNNAPLPVVTVLRLWTFRRDFTLLDLNPITLLALNRFQVANHFGEHSYSVHRLQVWCSCVSAMHMAEVCKSTRNDDDEALMETLKLWHAASNIDDLSRILQHRFDDLPVHILCYYYQAYCPIGCTSNVSNRYE
jgi:hypothetical protein